MKRAIQLAQMGRGLVSPNPLVGAVIVKGGRIVGEGYHRYDLVKHAESYALEAAGLRARGGTLFCTLEPCAHYGRTPPCSDAVVAAGIARAVIAVADPDQRVNGAGVARLRAAGIQVEIGLCAREAARVNEVHLKFAATGTPFVHAVIVHEPLLQQDWSPSGHFHEIAAGYDAVIMGNESAGATGVVRAWAGRRRHRPPVIAGEAGTLAQIALDESQVVALALDQADLGTHLRRLAELAVTSVLVLPGAISAGGQEVLRRADKLTIVGRSPSSVSLDEPEVHTAAGVTEVTGYPRKEI